MAWIGTWRNQFGSVLRIIRDAEGRIEGDYRTLSSRRDLTKGLRAA